MKMRNTLMITGLTAAAGILYRTMMNRNNGNVNNGTKMKRAVNKAVNAVTDTVQDMRMR